MQCAIFQGTLKDSLDRYSLYGLEDSADYDSGLKNEIEEQIKLVSIYSALNKWQEWLNQECLF